MLSLLNLHQLALGFTFLLLGACQFHLQGQAQLAEPLHQLCLQTPDPYGHLERSLKQYLKMSNVALVPAEQANATLTVLEDEDSQQLLSVSGTQQTRQYRLTTTVTFQVTDHLGRVILEPQTLSESRVITEQSNQILGSSNEATLFYQQMRRSLADAIINRLASKQVANAVISETIANRKKPL